MTTLRILRRHLVRIVALALIVPSVALWSYQSPALAWAMLSHQGLWHGPAQRQLLVIPVQVDGVELGLWTSEPEPGPRAAAGTLQQAFFGSDPFSAASLLARASSQAVELGGTISAPVRVGVEPLDTLFGLRPACPSIQWLERLTDRALAQLPAGQADGYDGVAVVFLDPIRDCQWFGQASADTARLWFNGFAYGPLIVHEIGHLYGLDHSSRAACPTSMPRLDVSPTACRIDTYGATGSFMGDPMRAEGFSPYELALMGLRADDSVRHLAQDGAASLDERHPVLRIELTGDAYLVVERTGASSVSIQLGGSAAAAQPDDLIMLSGPFGPGSHLTRSDGMELGIRSGDAGQLWAEASGLSD